MTVVAGFSTTYTPANIPETLALFEDNVDIFTDIELTPLPGLPSSEELLSFDGVNGAETFDMLFRTCMDNMASYMSGQTVESPIFLNTQVSLSPRGNETGLVQMNTGTFLAVPGTALQANQETENHWKRPKTFDCEYCSKRLFSSVAWHHHQVCHIKATLKCKHCLHTTRNLSSFRRHNEYYHGAKRKRHVFFDSC